MSDGRRERYVAHALAANFGLNDLNPALFTDHAAVLHSLITSAKTFVILDRTENLRAEETVFFRLKCSVIDGFRFFHLTMGPGQNFIR